MPAQTSDRVSTIAARFLNMNDNTLLALTATDVSRRQLLADIRSIAASVLRQDEHRGLRDDLRAKLKRVFGR